MELQDYVLETWSMFLIKKLDLNSTQKRHLFRIMSNQRKLVRETKYYVQE